MVRYISNISRSRRLRWLFGCVCVTLLSSTTSWLTLVRVMSALSSLAIFAITQLLMPKLSRTLRFAVGKPHLIYTWLLLLIAWSWPASAVAHGWGKPRLLNATAGPFRVTVWVLPELPRVGDLHISTIVDEAEVTTKPRDASPDELAVQIQLTSFVNPTLYMVQQTTRQVTFFHAYYESYFTLPTRGPWQVDVIVKGTAGTGATRFVLDVLPRHIVNWELIFWSSILLFTVIWALRVTRTAR